MVKKKKRSVVGQGARGHGSSKVIRCHRGGERFCVWDKRCA